MNKKLKTARRTAVSMSLFFAMTYFPHLSSIFAVFFVCFCTLKNNMQVISAKKYSHFTLSTDLNAFNYHLAFYDLCFGCNIHNYHVSQSLSFQLKTTRNGKSSDTAESHSLWHPDMFECTLLSQAIIYHVNTGKHAVNVSTATPLCPRGNIKTSDLQLDSVLWRLAVHIQWNFCVA